MTHSLTIKYNPDAKRSNISESLLILEQSDDKKISHIKVIYKILKRF